MSIAREVEDIVKRNPTLEEGLARGIINYGALAELIIPDIKKKNVTQSAVVMALRRLSENLKTSNLPKIEFDENSSITVRDGLIEITFEKKRENLSKLKQLFRKIDYMKGDFFTVTQGIYELTLITNKKYVDLVKETLEDEIIISNDDLSALTLTIPLDVIGTPGFFFMITRAFAWENINIEELVSTARELTLIVKSDVVGPSFNTMKRLINENQKLSA